MSIISQLRLGRLGCSDIHTPTQTALNILGREYSGQSTRQVPRPQGRRSLAHSWDRKAAGVASPPPTPADGGSTRRQGQGGQIQIMTGAFTHHVTVSTCCFSPQGLRRGEGRRQRRKTFVLVAEMFTSQRERCTTKQAAPRLAKMALGEDSALPHGKSFQGMKKWISTDPKWKEGRAPKRNQWTPVPRCVLGFGEGDPWTAGFWGKGRRWEPLC